MLVLQIIFLHYFDSYVPLITPSNTIAVLDDPALLIHPHQRYSMVRFEARAAFLIVIEPSCEEVQVSTQIYSYRERPVCPKHSLSHFNVHRVLIDWHRAPIFPVLYNFLNILVITEIQNRKFDFS